MIAVVLEPGTWFGLQFVAELHWPPAVFVQVICPWHAQARKNKKKPVTRSTQARNAALGVIFTEKSVWQRAPHRQLDDNY
jgi:hypothetical protein